MASPLKKTPDTETRLCSLFYYYDGAYFVVQVPEVFCILALSTKARGARRTVRDNTRRSHLEHPAYSYN